MQVYTYTADGGKDLIYGYIDTLPSEEQVIIKGVINKIKEKGIRALNLLKTRKIQGKIYEVKIGKDRLIYIIADSDNFYILHIFRKQKNETEKFEKDKAIKRAKELGRELKKVFV